MILPFLSAILGILAFLPPMASFAFGGPLNLYFFGFLFLVPLFYFYLKEEKLWRLVLGTFIFRITFALGVTYFTLEPIFWLTSIGIFLGLPISVYFVKKLLNLLNNSLIPTSYFLILSLPFLWTFWDLTEAKFSLMPAYIATAGNIFGSSPFLGLASAGGIAVLTFFAALINVLIVVFILKNKPQNSKFYILNSFIIILLVFAGWRISEFQLQKNSLIYDNLKNSVKIASVSVNENFKESDINKIKTELNGKKFDLVVFPEDILNHSLINNDSQSQTTAFANSLAKELKTNLAATFGTVQSSAGLTKKYNSSVLFNEKGNAVDIYNKNRLTFIGEYWPFGDWHPLFFDWTLTTNPEYKNYAVFNADNAYSRGEKKLLAISPVRNSRGVLNPAGIILKSNPATEQRDIISNEVKQFNNEPVNFASLICLEIHYPDDLKNYKKMGASFIINPTSNRWLDAGTKHFLYLSGNLKRIESVWLKIPIVSSGVNDYAGIILPDGKTNLINYESQNNDFGIFTGEIKF